MVAIGSSWKKNNGNAVNTWRISEYLHDFGSEGVLESINEVATHGARHKE